MAVIVSKGIVVPKRINFVEYIESTGTQYIDTGIVGKSGLKIRLKFIAGSYSGVGHLMTATNNWVTNLALAKGKGQVLQYGYNAAFHSSTTLWATGKMYDITFDASVGAQKLIINGETVLTGTDTGAFNVGYNLVLPGSNNRGNVIEILPMKICLCQIYDGETLVRDYWPCYDPDGVACLYDKVNEEYVYNAGTGEFIAGEAA